MIYELVNLVNTGMKIIKFVKISYTIMGVSVCVYKLYRKRNIPKQYSHQVRTTIF